MIKPVNLVSQLFFPELSAAPVDWPLGNMGDKLRIESIIDVTNYCIGSTDQPFTLNATDGYPGVGWLVGFGACFRYFRVGDTIQCYSQSAGAVTYTFTITDKLSDFEIRLSGAFTAEPVNAVVSDLIFSVTTAITAVKYHYNFVENSGVNNFTSIFDGSEQLLKIESKLASDVSVSNMMFTGPPEYQDGSATVQGVSISTTDGIWTSRYKIIHYIKIPPFLLFNQVEDLINGIQPNDFRVLKCWKFISMFEAAEVYTDPNFLVSDIFKDTLGNTGAYSENFNTGLTNYSISDVVYKNGGYTIPSIKFDASETTITFNVNNIADTPFSIGNTKFVLGFFKCPAASTEYQATGKFLNQNFLYDRALQTVTITAVNGDNYGGSYQVLKDVRADFVSSSQIKVTAKIAMGADVLASFSASSFARYLIYFSVKNHTKVTADAYNDLVTLPVDINTFTIVSSDPSMIIPDNTFIRHPEFDPETEGVQLGFRRNSLDQATVTIYGIAAKRMAISVTSNKLYVTNSGGAHITVINSLTNAVVAHITPTHKDVLVWDSFHNRIYATDIANGSVAIISCASDTVTGSITVPDGVNFIEYNPVNKYLYVTGAVNKVTVIDTVTNTIVTTITVGSSPQGVVYNSLMNTMYVANFTSNTVSVIDCISNTVIDTIALGGSDNPNWIVYNSIMNTVYVNCAGTSIITIVDCGTDTITGSAPGIGATYSGYFNVLENKLIVSEATTSTSLIIIDCLTNTVYTTVTLIAKPFGILFDPNTRKLFVANNSSNVSYIWVIRSTFEVFPEDEIVCCSDFYIESAGRESDVIKLTSINAKIIVYNGTDEFELDQFIMNTASLPLTGYTQEFDNQVPRAFHIPVGTIRKYIEIKRRHDLDTGTRKYFSSFYPILFRWETWTAWFGVDPSFFDSTLPNNGFNAWWFRYAQGLWTINYKLIINATKNGVPQQYILLNKITPNDYNSNDDFSAKTIDTKDPDTLTSLVSGGVTYILGYKNTLVTATFTKSTIFAGATIVIGLEVFGVGGIYGKRRYSSKWVADSDTWFASTDGSGKVELTISGSTVTGKCLIDFTQLPTGISSYKLSARCYDFGGNPLETDDGVVITTDGGIDITID